MKNKYLLKAKKEGANQKEENLADESIFVDVEGIGEGEENVMPKMFEKLEEGKKV